MPATDDPFCIEDMADILLLCYANYFGNERQTLPPDYSDTHEDELVEHYFTHFRAMEWTKGKLEFVFQDHPTLSVYFEMQGPKKLFVNKFVNLTQWQTLNNLTGAEEPVLPMKILRDRRERNWRVTAVAQFFNTIGLIPTLKEIRHAVDVYLCFRYNCRGGSIFSCSN